MPKIIAHRCAHVATLYPLGLLENRPRNNFQTKANLNCGLDCRVVGVVGKRYDRLPDSRRQTHTKPSPTLSPARIQAGAWLLPGSRVVDTLFR